MNRIKDYHLAEKLGETAGSLVYRAQGPDGVSPVILKMLKSRFPTSADIARLKHEYDIIRQIDCINIIQTHDLFSHENGLVLVLEDINGISVNRYLNQYQRFELRGFLNAGIQIANGLGELHRKNIIHSDIKPGNILINPESGLIKLSDFGIASIFARGMEQTFNIEAIRGTLDYISPEQTGRINQMVDHRADLYSLGATFYKMLTGSPPFISNDPLELIHSHIAREPVPPREIHSEIPEILSNIILKLLAKNAEDRYQNAFGLMVDLEKCRSRLTGSNEIPLFKLGKKDTSHQFILPKKLFGRKQDVKELQAAFDRTCGGSDPGVNKKKINQRIEWVLVSGESGIGKSSLIHELRISVSRKRGFYIYGKYEQFRGDTPYSAIAAAFRILIRNKLAESEEKITELGSKLLQIVGPNGKILTDILPELERILGHQPDVAELGADESRNRFNRIFEAFVDLLIVGEYPVVLFLDDLQWADSASLQLIQNILLKCQGQLLIIGTYRSNEVHASHPLQTAIQSMEKGGVPLTRIHLEPLTEPDVKDFLVSFLKCTAFKGAELAELIYEKTLGNPFFIHTFLNTLHKNRILQLDPHSGWVWDMDQITQMNITDNVVDMLAEKIIKLPEKVQEILKKGACIGIRFELETLSNLSDMPTDELLSSIDEAMETGFIRLSGNYYQFNHDRIREAAYNLLTENEKSAIHYRVGKSFLEQPDASASSGKWFFITDQLNLASDLITDRGEKEKLSVMNFECGLKAKSSAAFKPAMNYFREGIHFLESSCWTTQYDLALKLYSQAAESAFLAADYEIMESYVQKVLSSSKSVYDSMSVYETRINSFTARGNFSKSIETILYVLNKLKCRIPKNPSKLRVMAALLNIWPALSEKRIEALADLPEVKDRHMLAVFNMLSYLVRVSFITSQTLFAYATIKSARLSLKHGHCKANSGNHIGIAIIFITVLEDVETGYKLGKLALKLVDRYGSQGLQARTQTLFNMCVAHWKEDVRTLIPAFMKSYTMGMENGDPEYSAQSLLMRDGLNLLTGGNLVELEKQMAQTHATIHKLNQDQTRGLYITIWRGILELLGKNEADTPLAESGISQTQIEALWQSENARTFFGIYHVYQMINHYILDDLQGALKQLKALKAFEDSFSGLITQRDYHFYAALVLLARYPEASKSEKLYYKKFIQKSLKKFRKWTVSSPVNNEQRLKILEAEQARVFGKKATARAAFDEAIDLSKKNKFPLEEALAHELAGRFYAASGKNRLAGEYFTDAFAIFSAWGADAKITQLKAFCAELDLSDPDQEIGPMGMDTSTSITPTGSASQILDFSTVVKASQTISDEVELGKLLEKMMKITMENAGAQKGFMLLENNGDLMVEAEGMIENEDITVLKSVPLQDHDGLCSSIVHYVARSGKALILKNASEEGDFTRDSYVQKNSPKSILCSPIINQGKLIGVIYLENNLSAGVFTRERIELLNILSSQMSISIKNAKFYQDLEKKVRERTSQLKEANEQLKNLSFVDPLTQLHNRRYLYEFVSERSNAFIKNQVIKALGMDKRNHNQKDKIFGVYLLDIDHFKNVNDTYGHKVGDSVLVSIADVLRNLIRADDFLVRWGGEEFLVVLQNISREYLDVFPEKVRETVQKTPFSTGDGEALHKTCSIGYAPMPFDSLRPDLLTLEQTINLADFALYMAKENGRNRAVRIELHNDAVMNDEIKKYLINLSKNSKINSEYIRLQ